MATAPAAKWENPADLEVWPSNPRFNAHAVDTVASSISRFGFGAPIVANSRTGQIIAGHTRLAAARKLGLDKVPVRWLDLNDDDAAALSLADNKIGEIAQWDDGGLADILSGLAGGEIDLTGLGWDDEELDALLDQATPESGETIPDHRTLADRFIVPPFSVLNAREGWWQNRKRAWVSLGIRSEEGRGANLLKFSDTVLREMSRSAVLYKSLSGRIPDYYNQKNVAEKRIGRELTNEEFEADHLTVRPGSTIEYTGTSIFDPVVSELAYRWFSPPGGLVLDPFAGGSVRGVVAGLLGREYVGIDLREEQVDANRVQAAEINKLTTPGMVAVKVSSKMARLRFNGCDPDYIRDVCHASCCQSSSHPSGTLITIHESETAAMEARGAKVEGGMLQPKAGEKRCPFKTDEHLCGLHFTPDKPFGCIASPFTLNKSGTLIVRNRYIKLKCYNDGKQIPAYQAFRPSLNLIFGVDEAARISDHLDAGGGDLTAHMTAGTYAMLSANDDAKRVELGGGSEPTTSALPPLREQKEDTGAAWQKGIALARLREITQVFVAHDDGLVLGAFTGVKEQMVADAITDGTLRVATEQNRVVACAIVKTLKSGTAVRDFARRAMAKTKKGDLVISRFAHYDGRQDAVRSLLQAEIDGAPARARVWLEAWQEVPRDVQLVQSLGFEYVCTKIRASSEIRSVWCRGEYKPLASYDAPGLEAECLNLARLDLPSIDVGPLVEAIDKLGPTWAQHYSSYNKKESWSALAIRGYGGDPAFIIKPTEMSKKWKADHPDEMSWELADTELRSSLPEVEAIVDAIPGTPHRIRLMRLAPGGGLLERHADIVDPDAGSEDGRLLRIHIPLVSNERVIFESWSHEGLRSEAHMGVGEVWYLDTRKPHRARNDGPAERIHLVIDVEGCDELRSRLTENAPVPDPGEGVDSGPSTDDLGLAESPAMPTWITGDSRNVAELTDSAPVDFVFSCPPYADLEVYSDDPADISTLPYDEFLSAYRQIIANSCALLRDDRFAAVVVGEVRDKRGHYYNFVGDTIQAFRDAGLAYYNEAILVTSVGSLPIRAGRFFSVGRKLGKTHQNLLVFLKGDAKKAVEACGDVTVTVPDEEPIGAV